MDFDELTARHRLAVCVSGYAVAIQDARLRILDRVVVIGTFRRTDAVPDHRVFKRSGFRFALRKRVKTRTGAEARIS
jgi:hypothetical protein